ncbi:MAG: 4-alpha-glucanotransferase, partial [Terriglobales bacterium]
GLVCPWVYKADEEDALKAVQNGARLFSSPNLPDHPLLRQFSIVRTDQLFFDPTVPRYADDWESSLTEDQVTRFSALVDIIMNLMSEHGCSYSDVACEVLSTCPYPLLRVMERYSLGRFRVTQKADPADPANVYRSENAGPRDWIMVGNHDTKPIWRVAQQWQKNGEITARAQYLAERLVPDATARSAFADKIARDPDRLCQAMFADLFASPAQQISIFFSDLLGMTEVYNEPGTISNTNWSLRVPHEYEKLYDERVSRLAALSLPYALSMALGARFPMPNSEVLSLMEKLEGAG